MANSCFATKQEAMEQQRKIGELKKIELSHIKYNPRGFPCVVDGCDKTESEWHHFAPYHLFGVDADKWPAGYLCKQHHQQWHRLVTPSMSHQRVVKDEPEEKT